MDFQEQLVRGYVALARMRFTDNSGQPFTRAVVVFDTNNGMSAVRFVHTKKKFLVENRALVEF
jgi:hypothetical protein